ncbi:vascular cell adhesion protein 1-like [Micropterus salmoides]|uniref:vascular cell adhesion protein 1-like n=1 Tax=Micropterus salmoides TaxID=27706 RepID=UPI0018EB9379|nr:vascular cell adhesion protein 1-like [Micropterus salmoides]
MFFHLIILLVSLMSFLRDLNVFSCDNNCEEKPVFTPSRLVVKYDDPTSANCSVCRHTCLNSLFGLEKSVGEITTNGTTISWTVDRMTEWDTSPICYYNYDGHQCCSFLNVTLYQLPHNVSISFVNHSGPMLEGHQYTLQCTVLDVAPVKDLTVTFYRGHTALGQRQSNNNKEKKPVTKSFTFNITPSIEDDGVQYWCEAKLELGPEGPRHPPVVMSQNVTVTVYYKPHLKGSWHPDPVITLEGNPLQLNCSAVGNPSPLYTWTFPLASTPVSGRTLLTINSVTTADEGQYTCSVSNDVGSLKVKFEVVVQGLEYGTTTTTKTTTTSNSSTSSTLHRFIICFMLLFSALV